jgi:hypothetical protein
MVDLDDRMPVIGVFAGIERGPVRARDGGDQPLDLLPGASTAVRNATFRSFVRFHVRAQPRTRARATCGKSWVPRFTRLP